MSYSVRTAGDHHLISTHPRVDDAIASLEAEQLADHLHPDPALGAYLELVITHDRARAEPGDVVVRYTASRLQTAHHQPNDRTA